MQRKDRQTDKKSDIQRWVPHVTNCVWEKTETKQTKKTNIKKTFISEEKKKIKDRIIRDNQIIFEKEEKEERKNNIMKD